MGDGTRPKVAPEEEVIKCAEHLRVLSTELRSAGDLGLVQLDEAGVAPSPMTLADHLWLVAYQLDGRFSNPAPGGPQAEETGNG